MSQLKWEDSYNIGVEFIDKEHRTLWSTINRLLRISENEDKSEWACREGVKYLKNHTVQHFEHEEEYMRSIEYGEYDIHKRLHDDFRYKTLPALEEEMEEARYSEASIRHFMGVCIGWVVAHTQTEDQAIAGKFASKWGKLPYEEEVDALNMTIMQLIREMFHLKPKLLSEQYAGENFGKMVCCRFSYCGQKKEKWDVTLIFEECLALKIVGGILSKEYPKIDDMVINVTRYLSRQFLERIRETFPAIDLLNLEKECLLTHEQILNAFEREHPSCSLLYDTGEGYFAFSATAADSIRGKISSVVDPQHAMDAVQDYLVREQEEQDKQKPKLLVVDDSDFMRERIARLFSDDYELIGADSSISAIKKIAISRPDLVLLDYEMPICDGKQALEMIRSDKDIADIPVFFLTGRSDRESVKNVVSLNPSGYLLKTMSDEEIKKTIDNFFAGKMG